MNYSQIICSRLYVRINQIDLFMELVFLLAEHFQTPVNKQT